MSPGFEMSANAQQETDILKQTKTLVLTELSVLESVEEKLHQEVKEFKHLEENYKHVLVQFDALKKMTDHRRMLVTELSVVLKHAPHNIDLQKADKLIASIDEINLGIRKRSDKVYRSINALQKQEYHTLQAQEHEDVEFMNQIDAHAKRISSEFDMLSAEDTALENAFHHMKGRVAQAKKSRTMSPVGFGRQQ